MANKPVVSGIDSGAVPAVSAVASAVASAVQPVAFTLSHDDLQLLANAAEMASDANFDFHKVVGMVVAIFKPLLDTVLERDAAGKVIKTALTYEAWETVRVKFEELAEVRCRDNGAANPKGAAEDVWGRITVYLAANPHFMKKPKSDKHDAQRIAAKREEDAKKALESAAGRSSSELLEAQMALFAQANPKAIAEARAMDKIIKAVEKIEKDTVDAQMKPLLNAASENFKAALDHLKVTKDHNRLMDLIVALGAFVPAKS